MQKHLSPNDTNKAFHTLFFSLGKLELLDKLYKWFTLSFNLTNDFSLEYYLIQLKFRSLALANHSIQLEKMTAYDLKYFAKMLSPDISNHQAILLAASLAIPLFLIIVYLVALLLTCEFVKIRCVANIFTTHLYAKMQIFKKNLSLLASPEFISANPMRFAPMNNPLNIVKRISLKSRASSLLKGI